MTNSGKTIGLQLEPLSKYLLQTKLTALRENRFGGGSKEKKLYQVTLLFRVNKLRERHL